MTAASWQPDPTGRHQYRWWDGAQWTDNVSDNGLASHDPVQAAAPTVPTTPTVPTAPTMPTTPVSAETTWSTPGAGAAPTWPGASSTPIQGDPTGGMAAPHKRSPLVFVVPIVAVLAVAAVLFFVLGGGDDESKSGIGVTEVELAEGEAGFLELNLQRGDLIRIRVESEADETEFLIVADDDTQDAFIEAFETGIGNSEFSDFVTDVNDMMTDAGDLYSDVDLGDFRRSVTIDQVDGNNGFAATAIPILASGTYTVIYLAEEGEEFGKGRVIVEQFDGEIDDDVLDDFDEMDDFFSDSDNEDFFSDEAFFTDDSSYEAD